MRMEKLRFPGSQGHLLSAQLDAPDEGAPRAYALFAHCFTCTKNLKAVRNINLALTEAGIAVLRFDFTGLGESEGDFADTNFSSNVGDLTAAAAFLEANHQAPKILMGHSLGGAAVIQAAREIPSCAAVATIGAPFDPAHASRLFSEATQEIERQGEAELELGGRRFRIKKQFLDDLESRNVTRHIGELRRALLIFHSPVDEIVGIENAARIFKEARHPKSFVSLDKADHLLMDKRDSTYVGTVLAAWASRYL